LENLPTSDKKHEQLHRASPTHTPAGFARWSMEHKTSAGEEKTHPRTTRLRI